MFANLFKEMKAKKISQSDMAREINLTPTSLSRKMLGRSEFTYREMTEIRDKFFPSLTLDYLFDLSI